MATKDSKEPHKNSADKLRSFFNLDNPPQKQTGLPAKKRFNLWYFVLAMILFTYLQPLLFSAKTETISYSQFKQYVDQGVAEELIIGPDSIKGTLAGSPKRAFTTIRVHDPELVKQLDEGLINYSGRYENRFLGSLFSWILPLGIMFLIWRPVTIRMPWRPVTSTKPSIGWSPVSRRKTG